MTPASELDRLFAADFAAALQRVPRPEKPIQGFRPLTRTEGREYERQEMLDGRDRYARGDMT
jgi:hypothetical protein